jgi:hypothetical protein
VSENVAQSTLVIADVSRDIAGINQQASEMGAVSTKVQASAQNSTQLENLMLKFKLYAGMVYFISSLFDQGSVLLALPTIGIFLTTAMAETIRFAPAIQEDYENLVKQFRHLAVFLESQLGVMTWGEIRYGAVAATDSHYDTVHNLKGNFIIPTKDNE